MSLFEFLMVMVSLIIGLGIAELLAGVAGIIRHRASIQHYWVHSIFVLIVFIALLQQWWEIWEIHDMKAWTFLGLLMLLGGPVGLFLISHLIFPERLENADIETYYYGRMVPALWIGVATTVVATLFRPTILGSDLLSIHNLSSLLFITLFASMALIKNRIFHAVAALLILSSLLADILMISGELR